MNEIENKYIKAYREQCDELGTKKTKLQKKVNDNTYKKLKKVFSELEYNQSTGLFKLGKYSFEAEKVYCLKWKLDPESYLTPVKPPLYRYGIIKIRNEMEMGEYLYEIKVNEESLIKVQFSEPPIIKEDSWYTKFCAVFD